MTPDEGWTNSSNGPTPVESLVETILHELLHATHRIEFQTVFNNLTAAGTVPTDQNMYNALVASHGVLFAQMFVTHDTSNNTYSWVSGDQATNDAQHAYMATYADPLYQAAQQEFNNDKSILQLHVNDLQFEIGRAASNLGFGVDPAGGQGSGPTNADFQRTYDNLVSELQDLLQNYGWLIP